MSLLKMMKAAAAAHGFRPCGPLEDAQAYRDALIAHVRRHDYACAYELQLGRPQAEWTADEILAFKDTLMALRGPRTDPLPFLFQPMMETGKFSGPLQDGMVLAMADAMLKWFEKERRRRPDYQFKPMLDLLLMDGRTMATEVERGDRVAVLKTIAQQVPLYGFVLGCDAYVHLISQGGATATVAKREAILLHVGTRDLRIAKVRPYRRGDRGVVVFDDPPPADYDLRGPNTRDPYASIFVSVPMSATPQ